MGLRGHGEASWCDQCLGRAHPTHPQPGGLHGNRRCGCRSARRAGIRPGQPAVGTLFLADAQQHALARRHGHTGRTLGGSALSPVARADLAYLPEGHATNPGRRPNAGAIVGAVFEAEQTPVHALPFEPRQGGHPYLGISLPVELLASRPPVLERRLGFSFGIVGRTQVIGDSFDQNWAGRLAKRGARPWVTLLFGVPGVPSLAASLPAIANGLHDDALRRWARDTTKLRPTSLPVAPASRRSELVAILRRDQRRHPSGCVTRLEPCALHLPGGGCRQRGLDMGTRGPGPRCHLRTAGRGHQRGAPQLDQLSPYHLGRPCLRTGRRGAAVPCQAALPRSKRRRGR